MGIRAEPRRQPPARLARRAVLAAGLGGLAAVVTEAVVAPARIAGANGDTVRVGRNHAGTARTLIRVTGNRVSAFHGRSAAGDGVVGETTGNAVSGLYGFSNGPAGFGVTGRSNAHLTSGQLGGPRAGVRAEASGDTYALEAVGRLRFHSSGVIVVPKGQNMARVSALPYATTNAVVLATVQENRC